MAKPQINATKSPARSTEDFASATARGERTQSLLKKLRIPATPRNYELLYAFVTATNKELCSALRNALETHSRLREEDAESIYQTYLSNRDVSVKVDKFSSQVSGEMGEIMAVIEDASERAGSYGRSLKGVNAKLSGIESPQQLKGVLGELFETTNDMAEYNDVLEKRLAKSRKQIDELQMNLELTRLESFTDALTGLTNRKRFDQTIDEEMLRAVESDAPLSLLMLDIDHFKTFNDSYGHQTGDQVIRLVAHTLKINVKGRDVAARYGGEEFAILLPQTKLASAITVADQIRVAVKSKELVKKSTQENLGRVTLSIGVSVYRPGESIPAFMERADVCLYAAKNAGRDNVKAETDLPDSEAKMTAA